MLEVIYDNIYFYFFSEKQHHSLGTVGFTLQFLLTVLAKIFQSSAALSRAKRVSIGLLCVAVKILRQWGSRVADKGVNMTLSGFENILIRWKEEVATAGNKTNLKPKHIQKLEKDIDKIYAMHSKIARYEDSISKWIEGI